MQGLKDTTCEVSRQGQPGHNPQRSAQKNKKGAETIERGQEEDNNENDKRNDIENETTWAGNGEGDDHHTENNTSPFPATRYEDNLAWQCSLPRRIRNERIRNEHPTLAKARKSAQP